MGLNFHMPMVVDLSHPLIMLQGENGSGKSTLLQSIYRALKAEDIDGYTPIERRTSRSDLNWPKVSTLRRRSYTIRACSRRCLKTTRQMQEFVAVGESRTGDAVDVQGPVPYPARWHGATCSTSLRWRLSASNQSRTLKMLKELADQKNFRIIAATHSPYLDRRARNLRDQPGQPHQSSNLIPC